jgi:hypothetical protein
MSRTAHVYCGNNIGYGSMFEEPPECNYEGDVPLPENPEEDIYATFVCPGCGLTNNVDEHVS